MLKQDMTLNVVHIFRYKEGNGKEKRRNDLENKVSLASTSRRRFIPAGGTIIGKKASRLCAPSLANKTILVES
jgi:hypothetical protein